jgi:hypothetical protein
MQLSRSLKRMQLRGLSEAANPRRGQTAALAFCALCVSLLLGNAQMCY